MPVSKRGELLKVLNTDKPGSSRWPPVTGRGGPLKVLNTLQCSEWPPVSERRASEGPEREATKGPKKTFWSKWRVLPA